MLARRLPLLLAVALVSVAAHAQGRVAWETADHDFGSFEEGEQATYVFAFTNEGDRPVSLAEVRASCGCTTPTYTSGEIAPGARGEITVVYNSQGRPGTFEKSVYVRAAGAEPEAYTLHIRGRVVPATLDFGVTQGNVRFDTDDFDARAVAAEAPLAHTFRMQNAGERPIRIREARTFRDGVAVAFPQRPVFPGEVVEVTVTATAPAGGPFDLAVVLDTDDALQPAKSLRSRGQVGS